MQSCGLNTTTDKEFDIYMLLIDDRIGSNDLVKSPALSHIPTKLCRLDCADAAFIGNGPDDTCHSIGIELKSLSDFAGSSQKGRLQTTQITPMLDAYDSAWFLYYGEYRRSRSGDILVPRKDGWVPFCLGTSKRPITYRYFETRLITLAFAGVLTKHVSTKRDAEVWLAELYTWATADFDTHEGLQTFDRSAPIVRPPETDDRTMLRARVAKELPGLGFKRAMAAAQAFPSVQAMVNASEAEWLTVDKVGPGIAAQVVKACS